jgi:hypothetical protein
MSVGADTARYRYPIRHRTANALLLLAFATITANPQRADIPKKM